MQLGLEGKVAIVTGGSRGIGRATAVSLLDEGASVLAAARNPDSLDEFAKSLGADQQARLRTLPADMSKPEDIKRTVKACIDTFGKVDILVNNAGSARMGKFTELPDEAWLEDYGLKFLGYVRMAREVFPHMQRAGGGAIVNIIGAAAFNPTADYMIGGSANLALNHFTKALAKEGAQYGIRVVGINPGLTLTDRMERRIAARPEGMSREEFLATATLLGRPAKAEEVGDLVAFLASDRAAIISGTNVTIDGASNPSIMG